MAQSNGEEQESQPGSFVAPDPAQLSELLPAYEFLDLLACGGMGAVYRVRQLSLGRDVAIKVLPPELSRFEEFKRGFEVEARAMAKLSHTNLVGVYDFGEVAGMLYLVMEFVDGQSLFDMTSGQALDPIQAVEIVAGVAAGLGEAHKSGIVHRDIKPANILLTQNLAPKLGDFGLAVPADDVAAGMNMGTPGYVAPEVLADFESASAASDVFSLGMILHELLSGIVPTGEDNPNLELIPNLRGLRPLVSKSIAQHPRGRYPDGGAIAKELRTWLREAKKFPPHLLTNTPARVSSLTPRAPRPAPIASASPASGLALPLGGLAVIVLLAIVLVVVLGQGDKSTEEGQTSNPSESPSSPSNPPSSPADEQSNFKLEDHREEMLALLQIARTELIESRRANVQALQTEAQETDAWKSYLSNIDSDLGLLPRPRPGQEPIAIDEAMAALLNRFAIENQDRNDKRHVTALEKLHKRSVAALKAADALPTGKISHHWEAWVEWLGKSPFEILAMKPRGEWELWLAPPEEKGTIVTIGQDPVVGISAPNAAKSVGQLAHSPDGQITITREGGSLAWKLRWREPWLEGTNRSGSLVRFRPKPQRFVATAVSPTPSPADLPNPAKGGDPNAPKAGLKDAKLATLRAQYRNNLQKELGNWFSSYEARLGAVAQQAERRNNQTALAQIREELDRIEQFGWQEGYLAPIEIRSDNPVPSEVVPLKKKLEDKVLTTLANLQAIYLEALRELEEQHLQSGADTEELETELEPFLAIRRLDLSDFYNARPVSGSWTRTSARGLTGALTTLRSGNSGLQFEAAGILQLNSGVYTNKNSRMTGKDLNEYYGRDWPQSVTGIPVYQKARSVHMVGACIWVRTGPGTTAAHVILNFEDGSDHKIPLKTRQHVGNWDDSKKLPNASRIWQGGDKRCVYEIELKNPRPDALITTIDLESGKHNAGPFFLAMTLGH